MTTTTPSYYLFDNLIEASAASADNKLGHQIKIDTAKPFSNSNAAGVIAPMSFEKVGARASAFGRRCKELLRSTDA